MRHQSRLIIGPPPTPTHPPDRQRAGARVTPKAACRGYAPSSVLQSRLLCRKRAKGSHLAPPSAADAARRPGYAVPLWVKRLAGHPLPTSLGGLVLRPAMVRPVGDGRIATCCKRSLCGQVCIITRFRGCSGACLHTHDAHRKTPMIAGPSTGRVAP